MIIYLLQFKVLSKVQSRIAVHTYQLQINFFINFTKITLLLILYTFIHYVLNFHNHHILFNFSQVSVTYSYTKYMYV